jgi:poly(3-hydroxybutyrate) depolymerase
MADQIDHRNNTDSGAAHGKRAGFAASEHPIGSSGNSPLDRNETAIGARSTAEAGFNHTLKEDRSAREAMKSKTSVEAFTPPLEIAAVGEREKSPEKIRSGEKLFSPANFHIQKMTIKEDGTEVVAPTEIKLNAGDKLPAGDYMLSCPITLPNGQKGNPRMGRLHIPEPDPDHPNQPMPVVMALHGVLFGNQKPQDFQQKDLPLDKIAAQEQFIAFYPYAEQHSVDKTSNPIRIWNTKNTLKSEKHSKDHAEEVGYRECDFLTALPAVIKQTTNATEDGWTLVGHSAGVMAANESVSEPQFAGQFSSLVLLCGSMATDKNGEALTGKANVAFVAILRTRNQSVLPDPGPERDQRDNVANVVNNSRGLLAQLGKLSEGKADSPVTNLIKTLANRDPGLAQLITESYSPQALVNHYINQLGDRKQLKWERHLADKSVPGPRSPEHFNTLDTHFDPERDLHTKDIVDSITTVTTPNGNQEQVRTVLVINLPKAGHAVPNADPNSGAPGAYHGFDTLALVAKAIREGQRHKSAIVAEASQSRSAPMHAISFQDSKTAFP